MLKTASGQRPIEFSIGVFDDVAFTRPRPLRLGTPVASTVPAIFFAQRRNEQKTPPTQAPALSAGDAYRAQHGLPDTSRTVYFRVIADRVVNTGTDGTPVLLLELPQGATTEVALTASVDSAVIADAAGTIFSGTWTVAAQDLLRAFDGMVKMRVFLAQQVQMNVSLSLCVSQFGPEAAAPAAVTAPDPAMQ